MKSRGRQSRAAALRNAARLSAIFHVQVYLPAASGQSAFLKTLVALGYDQIWTVSTQWGTVFHAVEQNGLPVILVVDASPVVDGYPRIRVSAARVATLRELCAAHLYDYPRLGAVRLDYLVLPDRSLYTVSHMCITLWCGLVKGQTSARSAEEEEKTWIFWSRRPSSGRRRRL